VFSLVQREISKKTRIYGIIAVLCATMLVTLIFTFGTVPGILPPAEMPFVSDMRTFGSYEELRDFLMINAQANFVYNLGPLDSRFFETWSRPEAVRPDPVPAAQTADALVPGGSAESYSTTNIQVTGVDEADIVKTDGNYVYVAVNNDFYSASQNNVYIVKADPQDADVIAKIAFGNETYVAGLFLSQDSSRLVVIGSQYQFYIMDEPRAEIAIYPFYSEVNTFLCVYDVSVKASPLLMRNVTLSGSYFNSRMIGDYVYAVVSQPAGIIDDAVLLPQVYRDAETFEIGPERIYYADTMDNYFTFTTFVGLNILDDTQEPANLTVMMGGASTMYVSVDNIYVTYSTWNDGQYTSIYRVRVDGDELSFEAKGSVPGYVLNQYSMDEYNGHFRIATTWMKNTQLNNVYVLDMDLSLVGKLENLAEGETIYSVRFMGDKGYIVTFLQIDPFFVIDMSNPSEPKVSGELKIPGYSSYLHPFDENHVIGLGKENNTVKLSLFDVTDVNEPQEIAKYIVEGDWTDSHALYEPKAFLFDKEKELLAIPVSIIRYGVISPDGAVDSRSVDYYLQGGFWQGAYVFEATTSGFTLRGGITHVDDAASLPYYYGFGYNQQVNRALYIGNTLYTVSNAKMQLNNLDTLSFIAEVNLR
jgi:inhibitor of cysteine peptidase